MNDDVARATSLLGPLEARIMRAVWTTQLSRDFVVRDALAVIPELAYTTLMTTLNRLATKGLLVASQRPSERAHRYRAAPRDLAGGGDISGRVTVDQQEIGTQSGDDAAPVLIDPERTGCGVTECRRPQRPGPRVYTIGVY